MKKIQTYFMAGCLFLLCACYQPKLSFKEAVEQGDRQAVEYYLKKGASPNQRDAHATPLLVLAAQNGHLTRKQYNTIPPTVEYAMTAKG